MTLIAPHACVQCGQEGFLLCPACQSGHSFLSSQCFGCGRVTANYQTCVSCSKALPKQVYAVASYDDMSRPLVHGLKFGRQRAGAAVMASMMARQLRGKLALDCLICPIPTVPQRVRQRGYDQAVLLARSLSQELGLPFYACLARMGSQRQLGQGRSVRIQQLQNAFRPRNPHVWQNRPILLVDDVLTTGASLSAAAAVLRLASAGPVLATVFAVAPKA